MMLRPGRVGWLRRDARGVAAVEFALFVPLLGLVVTCLSDASIAYHAKMQVSEAVDAGVQYALLNGQSISGSPTAFDQNLQTFVAQIGNLQASAVQIAYNNNLSATQCYCVTGATATFSGPFTCGSTCSGSSMTAGKFVSITATYTYHPIFAADRFFTGGPLTETSLVRLQ